MTGLKVAAGVFVLLLSTLLAQMLFAPPREAAQALTQGMPWQIESPGPGQSRVFGLTLGGGNASTLADARRLSAEAPKLALLEQFGIGRDAAEAALSGLIWVTALTVAAAIPTAILAKRKGRWVAGWIILALSIPVLPLLLVWLLPKLPDKSGR